MIKYELEGDSVELENMQSAFKELSVAAKCGDGVIEMANEFNKKKTDSFKGVLMGFVSHAIYSHSRCGEFDNRVLSADVLEWRRESEYLGQPAIREGQPVRNFNFVMGKMSDVVANIRNADPNVIITLTNGILTARKDDFFKMWKKNLEQCATNVYVAHFVDSVNAHMSIDATAQTVTIVDGSKDVETAFANVRKTYTSSGTDPNTGASFTWKSIKYTPRIDYNHYAIIETVTNMQSRYTATPAPAPVAAPVQAAAPPTETPTPPT